MTAATRARPDRSLSLYHLLDPAVLANPYPLYTRLRTEDPVHWDPFLHAWIVTRYADVVTVFQQFSADRTPRPEHLEALGLGALSPLARVMVRQMLFMDGPGHGRIRGLAARAFTPRRIEGLRAHIGEIVDGLLDAAAPQGRLDIINDLAYPLPAIVTAELLGVPAADRDQLKLWSEDFAEVLGNFQHNPDRAANAVKSVEAMCGYFREAIREHRDHPRDDLISAFIAAEIEGDRLNEEEMIANLIVTMVGGQETTTNLIGNGMLTLLRHPEALAELQADLSLVPAAVEEMLRFESPSQHTARLAPADTILGGKAIRQRQAVIAVMGAANRDPERFPDPDRFDLHRADNRHLAFAWASHFCFGAPLARMEAQSAFTHLLRRFPTITQEARTVTWRENMGLRGLMALPVLVS